MPFILHNTEELQVFGNQEAEICGGETQQFFVSLLTPSFTSMKLACKVPNTAEKPVFIGTVQGQKIRISPSIARPSP